MAKELLRCDICGGSIESKLVGKRDMRKLWCQLFA